ncbi:MAG: hypothetical protein NXI18_22240 [Alphaproteobacteria bacterium]|nr:hypothetical protein [Alphaproteobacteria bacterium]
MTHQFKPRFDIKRLEMRPRNTSCTHLTVRDLMQKLYRKEQLRSAILDHELLDTPLEKALLNQEQFLKEFFSLPHVGRKAVTVLSRALRHAETVHQLPLTSLEDDAQCHPDYGIDTGNHSIKSIKRRHKSWPKHAPE